MSAEAATVRWLVQWYLRVIDTISTAVDAPVAGVVNHCIAPCGKMRPNHGLACRLPPVCVPIDQPDCWNDRLRD